MTARILSDRFPGLLFAGALITTLRILWIVVLPVLDFQALPKHHGHVSLLLVHAVGGLAMLLLGATALYIGWTQRAFKRHRWFGYGYLGLGSMGQRRL